VADVKESLSGKSDNGGLIDSQFLELACNIASSVSKALVTAKFVFVRRIKWLDSSEQSADVAKWQTQRT
jgi:hypothetical protein